MEYLGIIPFGALLVQSVLCACYMRSTGRRLKRIEDQLDSLYIIRPGSAIQLSPPAFVPRPPPYPPPSAPPYSPQDPMPHRNSYCPPDSINVI